MSDFSLMAYAPIGIMFLVAMGFAGSQLLVTQLIGPRKRTATKLMPYECGKDPIGGARNARNASSSSGGGEIASMDAAESRPAEWQSRVK